MTDFDGNLNSTTFPESSLATILLMSSGVNLPCPFISNVIMSSVGANNWLIKTATVHDIQCGAGQHSNKTAVPRRVPKAPLVYLIPSS